MAQPQQTVLPPPGADPFNVQAPKHFVFNETGNIMLATTDVSSHPIEASVRAVFAEVSVFFAAMTKAITTTINPVTNQPYSLYNYTALNNVIAGSGFFVHVTEEDVTYSTQSYGVTLSRELIEALLGLPAGAGGLSFASAMIASMGQEAVNINAEGSSSDTKVANIVFVCEYLLGMPVVSAIVVYADVSENLASIQAGPCFSAQMIQSNWVMHKDTYMFVTPAFIRNYAPDLESIETDPDYLSLIDSLSHLVTGTPQITSVTEKSGAPVTGSSLTTGSTYTLNGVFLPASPTVKFVSASSATLQLSGTPTALAIDFSVSGTSTKPAAIGVYSGAGGTTLASQTAVQYTVGTKAVVTQAERPAAEPVSPSTDGD